MKFFILLSLISLPTAFAQTTQNKKVGTPANPVSQGQSDSSGISNGPTGPNRQEAQEMRSKTEGMGGAPNAGGGMGTGTGAGTTVGKKIKNQ
jgi:hypothetical protein